jgi:hypothetical protein
MPRVEDDTGSGLGDRGVVTNGSGWLCLPQGFATAVPRALLTPGLGKIRLPAQGVGAVLPWLRQAARGSGGLRHQ